MKKTTRAELERFALLLQQLDTCSWIGAAEADLEALIADHAPGASPGFIDAALDIAAKAARDDAVHYRAMAWNTFVFAKRLRALKARRAKR